MSPVRDFEAQVMFQPAIKYKTNVQEIIEGQISPGATQASNCTAKSSCCRVKDSQCHWGEWDRIRTIYAA